MKLPFSNIEIELTEAIACLKHTLRHINNGQTLLTNQDNLTDYQLDNRLINWELLPFRPEDHLEAALEDYTTPQKYLDSIIQPLWNLVHYTDESDRISGWNFGRKLNTVKKNEPLVEQAHACIGIGGVPHILDDRTYLLGLAFRLFFNVVLDTWMPGFEDTVKPAVRKRLAILEHRIKFYELHKEPEDLARIIGDLDAEHWATQYHEYHRSKIGIHQTINYIRMAANWALKHDLLQGSIAKLQAAVQKNRHMLGNNMGSHESEAKIHALIANGHDIANSNLECEITEFEQLHHAVHNTPANILTSNYHRVLANPEASREAIIEAWKTVFNEGPEPQLAALHRDLKSANTIKNQALQLIHEFKNQMAQLQSLQHALQSSTSDNEKEQRLALFRQQVLEINQRSNLSTKSKAGPPLQQSHSNRFGSPVSAVLPQRLLLTTFSAVNSCFREAEVLEIQEHIYKLAREIKSFWPYPNKDRKLQKMAGLHALLLNSTKVGAEVNAIIEEVANKYPDLRVGQISTRTSDLLDKLRESHAQNQSICL